MRADRAADGRTCALPTWLTCAQGDALLRRLGIDIAPAVQDARVVGVAERRKLSAAPEDSLVASALSSEPAMCREFHGLGVALAIMRARKLSELPVLDADNRPVGTLRLIDIARALARRPSTPPAQSRP